MSQHFIKKQTRRLHGVAEARNAAVERAALCLPATPEHKEWWGIVGACQREIRRLKRQLATLRNLRAAA